MIEELKLALNDYEQAIEFAKSLDSEYSNELRSYLAKNYKQIGLCYYFERNYNI